MRKKKLKKLNKLRMYFNCRDALKVVNRRLAAGEEKEMLLIDYGLTEESMVTANRLST